MSGQATTAFSQSTADQLFEKMDEVIERGEDPCADQTVLELQRQVNMEGAAKQHFSL